MSWWAIVEEPSGRLKSVGDVLADPLASALTAILLPSQQDQQGMIWDQVTRTFILHVIVPRPSSVDLVMSQPEIQAMNNLNQDRVRTVITRLARQL